MWLPVQPLADQAFLSTTTPDPLMATIAAPATCSDASGDRCRSTCRLVTQRPDHGGPMSTPRSCNVRRSFLVLRTSTTGTPTRRNIARAMKKTTMIDQADAVPEWSSVTTCWSIEFTVGRSLVNVPRATTTYGLAQKHSPNPTPLAVVTPTHAT